MVGFLMRHEPSQASALGPGSRRRHLPSTVLSMHPIALKCCVESKPQTFAEFRTKNEENAARADSILRTKLSNNTNVFEFGAFAPL